jgi:hypothetical protein
VEEKGGCQTRKTRDKIDLPVNRSTGSRIGVSFDYLIFGAIKV